MANTKFEDIYARYRSRVKDYSFLDLEDSVQQALMFDLLTNAIDDFSEICKQDLDDYDKTAMEFNFELTRREKEILALGMAYHWLEPFVLNEDALSNALSTKDFTLYSPANLLEKMTTLYVEIGKRLKAEINLYSFKSVDISELTS